MVRHKRLRDRERDVGSEKAKPWRFTLLMLFLVPLIVSCSSLQSGKSDGAPKTPAVAKAEERPPRPGDAKIIDGVEFEYVRNVLFSTVPAQPEYQWEKKVKYGY